MALFTKLPNWASILITVLAAVIVVGLVSWGTYTLVKPGPSKLPEGEEVAEEEGLPEEEKPLPEEEDEFANWKTYQNEEYGFEVKYPGDWKMIKDTIEESDFALLAFAKSDAASSFYRCPNPGIAISFQKNGFSDKVFIENEYFSIEEKDVVVANIPAKKIIRRSLNDNIVVSNEIYLEKDNPTISFSIACENVVKDSEKEYYDLIFNQILSTFKFID